MNPAFKKALKIGGWSLGGLLGLLLIFIGLLAFPGFMFAHQLEYRNLAVHANQDLRGRMEPILARVDAQIAARVEVIDVGWRKLRQIFKAIVGDLGQTCGERLIAGSDGGPDIAPE